MSKLSKFVLSMGKIGLIGFGGGSVLIPVIENEAITRQGIDTKKNYDKDVVVASITPGALPLELAGSLGKRNFGVKGMLLGPLMMALPGALATVLLLTLFSSAPAGLLRGIEVVSIGVTAFIMYLLTGYISSVMRKCKQESDARFWKAMFCLFVVLVLSSGKNVYSLFGIDQTPIFSVSTFHILLAAFFCILYTQSRYNWLKLTVTVLLGSIYLLSYGKSQLIHNVYITRATEVLMLVLSVYGVVQSFRRAKNKKKLKLKEIAKDALVWAAALVVCSLPAVIASAADGISYVSKGLVSALMSFGGGDAYLTIADGLFVDGGFVTAHQFYGQIVTLVNVLPGSILCKTLSGVGYYTGLDITGKISVGLAFALAGFACSIALSCGCFAIVYYLYDSMTSLGVFKLVSRWIRPIISGLLVNIMLSLLNQDIVAADNAGISTTFALVLAGGMYVMNLVLEKKFKCKQTVILLLNIAIPLVLLLFL